MNIKTSNARGRPRLPRSTGDEMIGAGPISIVLGCSGSTLRRWILYYPDLAAIVTHDRSCVLRASRAALRRWAQDHNLGRRKSV